MVLRGMIKIRKYTGIFDYFSPEQFETPDSTSTVIVNSYWIVTDGELMRDKRTGIWQYHVRKEVAERISSELPGTEVHYKEFCYVPRKPIKVE